MFLRGLSPLLEGYRVQKKNLICPSHPPPAPIHTDEALKENRNS